MYFFFFCHNTALQSVSSSSHLNLSYCPRFSWQHLRPGKDCGGRGAASKAPVTKQCKVPNSPCSKDAPQLLLLVSCVLKSDLSPPHHKSL